MGCTIINQGIQKILYLHDFSAHIKNLGGFTIRVKRGPDPHWTGMAEEAQQGDEFAEQQLADIGIHKSEWDHTGAPVDFIVTNDGTLEQLHDKVGSVMKVLNNITKIKRQKQVTHF